MQWLISPCCSHAHILPPYIYTTYIYHSCSAELTAQWDHLHLVRWACVGVGNVQTTTEYCANYRHVIPLKHNSNTVHPVSAITRTKWSTQDTNSLLPDSQRLVILFHIRNVKTLWANFSPHIYHKPLAGPALLVPPGLNLFLSRVLYISSHHSWSQIEAGNWERGENEKPLTAGPPAYVFLLNRFRLTRYRKYSPLHLLAIQLIRPEDLKPTVAREPLVSWACASFTSREEATFVLSLECRIAVQY